MPFTTLAEKCAWDSLGTSIFCAVPQDDLSGRVLPDEYLRGEVQTHDSLVSISATTSTTASIPVGRDFDTTNMTLTKNDSYLFFTNRADGTLWRLKAK